MKLILENWRKYLDEVEAMDSIPGMETQEGRQRSIDYFWDGGRENLEDTFLKIARSKNELA